MYLNYLENNLDVILRMPHMPSKSKYEWQIVLLRKFFKYLSWSQYNSHCISICLSSQRSTKKWSGELQHRADNLLVCLLYGPKLCADERLEGEALNILTRCGLFWFLDNLADTNIPEGLFISPSNFISIRVYTVKRSC